MQRINSFAQVSKYLLTYSFAPMFAPLLVCVPQLTPLAASPCCGHRRHDARSWKGPRRARPLGAQMSSGVKKSKKSAAAAQAQLISSPSAS